MKLASIACAAVAVAAATPVCAATTVYTSQSSFVAATGASAQTTPMFTTTNTQGGAVYGGSFAGYPGDAAVTFNFASAVNSFGVTLLDFGTFGTTTLSATTTAGTTVLLSNFSTSDNGLSKFVGFSDSANLFSSVSLQSTAGGDYVEFSNVLAGTSAVPEPATWAMMLIGFGAVGASMRRRQTSVRIQFA